MKFPLMSVNCSGEQMNELTKSWKKVKLRDVAEFTNGGAWNSKEYTESGISVVQVTNISSNTIDLGQCKYLSPESLTKYKKHILLEGDLVIATVGSHPTQPNSVVGRVAIIPKFAQGSLLNQNALRLSPKNKELDKKYLGQLGKSQFFRDYIIAHARGSANQVRMSIELLKEMDIYLPPLPIQKKIASILSSYDDLIENNTRRIEILEQMTKLVYEEWFVKFRFPGYENVKMVPSELGEIPGGWKAGEVSEILKRLKAGKKYTQDNVLEEGLIQVIDQSEKEILGFHNDVADHSASLKNPIMIFGDHTCKIKILIEPFSIGPNVVPFISKSYPDTFVFFLIKNLVQTKEYKRHWNVLQAKKVILPDITLAIDFVNVINPLFQQITLFEHKNQNLRKTRDLLLPKLISGEIDVSDLDIHIRNEFQES